jgi:DNA polymerase III delta prime subunit
MYYLIFLPSLTFRCFSSSFLYRPGKTTSVHALARELLGSYYKDAVLELNASDARGIDVGYTIFFWLRLVVTSLVYKYI